MRLEPILHRGGVHLDGGHRWTTATTGLSHTSPLYGVSCVGVDDCYAAGQYDPRTVTTAPHQQPLIARWASRHWAREPLRAVPTVTSPVWSEDNLLVPSFFGISCVPEAGCTAVGAQPQGAQSAALAMSDLPPAVAGG